MQITHEERGTEEAIPAFSAERERRRIEEVLRRVLCDLAMITDRDIALESLEVDVASGPVGAAEGVQIAFKLALRNGGKVRRGCLLVPLPDAISLACYLMMVSDEGVRARRVLTGLDGSLKDSLLEVGNFIAGAAEGALRDACAEESEVRTEGCQGLRPGAAPALAHAPGLLLTIGRGRAVLRGFPAFDLVLQLPNFP